MKKPRRAFEVLGSAPPGFSCALCGQEGDDMLQILMAYGRVGLMHRACAEKHFRVPVSELTKVAAVLDQK